MFRFAAPYFLILLALIPAAIYIRRRKTMLPVLGLPTLKGAKAVPRSWTVRLHWLLAVLKYGALMMLIVALARPQWGTRHENVLTKGVNIVLAVDLSESMAALDFRRKGKIINRLEAVKGVVAEFIGKRKGDRIGMVVFGSQAYTQVPLTRDYDTIASILQKLKIGAAGKQTAIGDAIGIALKRLADIASRSNLIIVLTDGQSNAGHLQPLAAAKIAADRGVKIYTIGVGTRGQAPFVINDPVFGKRTVFQRVNIDEATLEKIADATSGLYFRADDVKRLQEIYDTIDALEKTEVKIKVFTDYREYYPYLLWTALALLGIWCLLTNTRMLRVP